MKSIIDYWIEAEYFSLRYELDMTGSVIPIRYDGIDNWSELF